MSGSWVQAPPSSLPQPLQPNRFRLPPRVSDAASRCDFVRKRGDLAHSRKVPARYLRHISGKARTRSPTPSPKLARVRRRVSRPSPLLTNKYAASGSSRNSFDSRSVTTLSPILRAEQRRDHRRLGPLGAKDEVDAGGAGLGAQSLERGFQQFLGRLVDHQVGEFVEDQDPAWHRIGAGQVLDVILAAASTVIIERIASPAP